MNAMCLTNKIVSKQWVVQCAQEAKFLPADPFVISSIAPALDRAHVARTKGGLFQGCSFYVHKSVPAKDGNPSKESLGLLFKITGGKKVDAVDIAKMMRGGDVSRLVVMAADGAELPMKVSNAIKEGATKLSCSKFLEAVQNQLPLECIHPTEGLTDKPGVPTATLGQSSNINNSKYLLELAITLCLCMTH